MKVTRRTKEILACRRHEKKMKAQGFEYVGDNGGLLWEIHRGKRMGHKIVAVEIAANGLGLWVKIQGEEQ